MTRAVPLFAATARLLMACCGGGNPTPPPDGTATSTPPPGAATVGPGTGSLPELGAPRMSKFPDLDVEAIVGHPLGQPIGNELVVEPGTYTLTIHRAAGEPGVIETCQSSPVAQAPLQIATSGRAYAFLYATSGQPEIEVLVVPLDS